MVRIKDLNKFQIVAYKSETGVHFGTVVEKNEFGVRIIWHNTGQFGSFIHNHDAERFFFSEETVRNAKKYPPMKKDINGHAEDCSDYVWNMMINFPNSTAEQWLQIWDFTR